MTFQCLMGLSFPSRLTILIRACFSPTGNKNMIFFELKATKAKLGFSGSCGFQLLRAGAEALLLLCWYTSTLLVTSRLGRRKVWLIFVQSKQKYELGRRKYTLKRSQMKLELWQNVTGLFCTSHSSLKISAEWSVSNRAYKSWICDAEVMKERT